MVLSMVQISSKIQKIRLSVFFDKIFFNLDIYRNLPNWDHSILVTFSGNFHEGKVRALKISLVLFYKNFAKISL